MEAIHRKDSSEVPCQPKNPRDSFFKDLKVERMVLDRTQMDRVSRLREPFRVHQCSRQHFLSRDRQTRAGAVSAPLRFLWTVREPIHRNTVQDPLRPANSDPEASSASEPNSRERCASMTENSAIFNARHGAGSFRPHRQPAPTAQDCLKRGNGANWRTTRQLSGECRFKQLCLASSTGATGG
jgi:hypothetical protein